MNSQNIKVLNVPIIGQYGAQYCAMASIEMAIRYHTPSTFFGQQNKDVQCGLNDLYTYYYTGDLSSPYVQSGSLSCPSDCDDSTGYPIQFPRRGQTSGITPAFTSLIFNHFDYYAEETPHTDQLTWEDITTEINSCRPFLLFLKSIEAKKPLFPWLSTKLIRNNHVIAVKGYYEPFLQDSFLIANDPLTDVECQGCEDMRPVSILAAPTNMLYSGLAVADLIQPRNSSLCDTSCAETGYIPEIVQQIKDHLNEPTSIFNVLNATTFSSSDMTTIMGSGLFFSNNYQVLFGVASSSVAGELTILTSQVPGTENLSFYFIKNAAGDYELRRIIHQDCTLAESVVMGADQISGDQYEFPWDGPGGIGIRTFRPGNEHFYRVLCQEKPYWIPVKNYPHLSLEQGILYPERKVLRKMKCSDRKRLRGLRKKIKAIREIQNQLKSELK